MRCKACRCQTEMEGTGLCDRCWNIKQAIELTDSHPKLVGKLREINRENAEDCGPSVSESSSGCEQLEAAFKIFGKYTDQDFPTCCEHDILYVCVDPQGVSFDDLERLENLGFVAVADNFESHRFGS